MTIVPQAARPSLILAILLAHAIPLAGQSPAASPRTSYWITAGAGWAVAAEDRAFGSDNGTAFLGAATLQRGWLVASARGVRTTAGSAAIWDAGLLAGVGSSTRFPMRGSIAAGLGRINGAGASAWTLPVELQLAWRVSPRLAIAAYGFGSFAGPYEMLGATLAVQVGRWH